MELMMLTSCQLIHIKMEKCWMCNKKKKQHKVMPDLKKKKKVWCFKVLLLIYASAKDRIGRIILPVRDLWSSLVQQDQLQLLRALCTWVWKYSKTTQPPSVACFNASFSLWGKIHLPLPVRSHLSLVLTTPVLSLFQASSPAPSASPHKDKCSCTDKLGGPSENPLHFIEAFFTLKAPDCIPDVVW